MLRMMKGMHTETEPHKGRTSVRGRTRICALVLAGALAVLVLLCPAVARTLSGPSDVVRVCILPFYLYASRASLDADLGPLLEADLSGIPWLELIPAKTVYEEVYELQPEPWFVNGFWGGDPGTRDAEVYVWLRQRLLQRARSRFPSDYYIVGRVISTGIATHPNWFARCDFGPGNPHTPFRCCEQRAPHHDNSDGPQHSCFLHWFAFLLDVQLFQTRLSQD